jgi:hypothetical protein
MLSAVLILFTAGLSCQTITGVFGSYAADQSLNEVIGPFVYIEVDSNNAGDVKLVGDIDGDSFPDLVIGGMPGENLNWYRYPDWEKTLIATPNIEFTTDGELGDVDGDGDLDIVVPDGNQGNNLLWFENPLPDGNPSDGAQWKRNEVGAIGSWGKDIELADFDGNGTLDIAARSESEAMSFFQAEDRSWDQQKFSGLSLGNEGMTSGDVDSDGDIDLVVKGEWVRNPGGENAQTTGNWTRHTIGTADNDFKALVVDLDGDGDQDVLFSSSEGTANVEWWSADSGDPTGNWTSQIIIPALEKGHTLQAADMDLDGDMDVVLAQMHTSANKEIFIMYNQDGSAMSWEKQIVGTGGLHNGVVADIGSDGDYDIYGANWTGNPPVRLYESQMDKVGSLSRWSYKEVASGHAQTFGLGFGDADGDGKIDILSGRYWYRNPGGDMSGTWERGEFPDGMHAAMVVDVDGDEHLDVIAQKDDGSEIGLYWLEEDGGSWSQVKVGGVDRASHGLGAQGYRVGQIESGGREEVALSSGNGIYYFRIPENPGDGNWPRVHVSGNPSDEGLALGDIDEDGQLDIAATTGDSLRVEWYRNPGDGSGEWDSYHIGTFDGAVYPDRTEIGDLDGDGKLDIIVSEENGLDSDAETRWWQQPADPTSGNWESHLITTQATTNSMEAADMDQDGDLDVILGEHRGSEKLAIWVNDGDGNLTELVVGSGKENHLGARTVDLDGDGDLDVVGIAWDDYPYVHLWRNDNASSDQPVSAPTPTNPEVQSTETDTTPAFTQAPAAEIPQPGVIGVDNRAVDGLQAFYTFMEGSGDQVRDSSGVGSALDLSIADPDNVTWLSDGGLKIESPTIISSRDKPLKILQAVQQTNEISLELWIAPDNADQDGPARIVSISFDPFNRNFTLGQEFVEFEVRLRTTASDENGNPSISTQQQAVQMRPMHLVYSRAQDGAAQIYIDGVLSVGTTASGDFSKWNPDYPLILGNELSNDRPWLGTYYLLAFYNRQLSENEILQNYQAGYKYEIITAAAPENTPSAPQPSPTVPPTIVSAGDLEPTDTVSAVFVPSVQVDDANRLSNWSIIAVGIGLIGLLVVVIAVVFFLVRRKSS